jgi:uncharacterized protein
VASKHEEYQEQPCHSPRDPYHDQSLRVPPVNFVIRCRFCSSERSFDMAIYLDADACPVKEEVYRVARRYELKVYVVANSPLRIPTEILIELTIVKGGFDAVDDWIAERIGPGDIAITADIPLADRCLRRGARVMAPKGLEFTEDSIGNALATRALLDMLRQSGEFGGGPAPFVKADRSRFLAKLDEMIHATRRDRRK